MALDDNEKQEETTSLVKSVSSTREKLQGDSSQILHEEQRKLAQTLMQQIFTTRSLEEVEAIKKMIAPLQPTLDAIRSNKSSYVSLLPSNVPENKKIEPQRRLFNAKKKAKKQKTLSAPSSDEIDLLAVQLLHPNT